jgi:ATP-dependent Clp protease ATP-binding subunit ClpB
MVSLQRALVDMNESQPNELLDASKLSEDAEKLQSALLSKIIGQDRAVKQVVSGYIPTTVNMQREGRPLGVYLFLGPTGVGKSETVKQFARFLLGKTTSLTKIDCTEFQQEHETAKLLGAPPGYVGFEKSPRLAQKEIDKHQTQDKKINILLFDEIEKADNRLFDAIMGILGDATLTLGNGQTTDFSNSFIFLTSNLGSHEIRRLLRGEGMGFQKMEKTSEDVDSAIYRVSKKAAEKKWRPEFINRVDKIIVFRPLSEDSLRTILKNELKDLQWRIYKSAMKGWTVTSPEPMPPRQDINFRLNSAAMNFLLKEGTSEIYGARELNRAVDRFMNVPLASLISSGQLKSGDKVKVEHVEGATDLKFTKENYLIQ